MALLFTRNAKEGFTYDHRTAPKPTLTLKEDKEKLPEDYDSDFQERGSTVLPNPYRGHLPWDDPPLTPGSDTGSGCVTEDPSTTTSLNLTG